MHYSRNQWLVHSFSKACLFPLRYREVRQNAFVHPQAKHLPALFFPCCPQLPAPVKAYLQQAEEAARCAKEEQRHALWDDKMRATQTQSAFGIRVT